MERIKAIDKVITTSVAALKKEIELLNFNEICEFKLNKEHIPEIPWGTLNYPGIYLLEIKNNGKFDSFETWVNDFKKKWEDEAYRRWFTPNLKKKRIEKHTSLEEWIPIYIGKSKRIEGRVHEHIFKELTKTTFALKLNAREHLQSEIFRLKTIKCEVENYDLILPIIESELRDRINPLIGRQ